MRSWLVADAARRSRLALGGRVRAALRQAVYGSQDLPSESASVTSSYAGLSARSSWPSDVSRVDRLDCPTVLGGVQQWHLCYPAAVPALHAVRSRLVVHIGGHSAAGHYYASDGQAWLTYTLLREGFHVLGGSMSMVGFNTAGLGGSESYSTGAVANHDFSAVETAGVSGLRPFVDGAICAIAAARSIVSPLSVDVVGLSGGGWTATMLGALDPSIRRTISVYGGAPWWLRSAIGSSAAGDWEQLAARSWVPALRGLEESAYVACASEHGRRRVTVLGLTEGVFPVGGHLDLVERMRRWVDARVPAEQHRLVLDATPTAHDISVSTRSIIVEECSA